MAFFRWQAKSKGDKVTKVNNMKSHKGLVTNSPKSI